MIVLLGKVAIAIACAILGAILGASKRVHAMPRQSFDRLAIGLGVASRLAIFVLLFIVLGFDAQSDVPSHYHPQALHALDGKVVYRDFRSSYAPLFPYFVAIATMAWRSAKSIVLFAIVLEALSLPLWLRAARAALDERAARVAMVLYVCGAPLIVNVAVEGQNQVYCSLLFALSFALVASGRPFLSGLAAGASTSLVKILAVIQAPGPFAASGSARARWAIGAALVPAIAYGGFFLAGADVMYPVRVESGLHSSGNVPYLLMPLFGRMPKLYTAVLVLALGAVVGWALIKGVARDLRGGLYLDALVLMTFMLVSQKSYTHYLVLGYFPLAAAFAARSPSARELFGFGLFGLFATLEPSLWFRWLKSGDLRQLAHPAAGVSRAEVGVFLIVELALVASYAWLWWRSLSALRDASKRDAMNPALGARNQAATPHVGGVERGC